MAAGAEGAENAGAAAALHPRARPHMHASRRQPQPSGIIFAGADRSWQRGALIPLNVKTMHEKTILLIEDDRDSRWVYGTALRHAGCHVLEAADGGEGILMAREHQPDLIVMDLGLPTMDGWTATETIKSDPEIRRIPVVAITVHVQDFYRGRAQVVGCDSFLDKPCSPTRLLGEITRILGEVP